MRKPSSDAMESVVRTLCERIDTPRALSVWLCYKYNQEALLELPLPDIAVGTSGSFHEDYFITEYLQKYKGLKLQHDPRERALSRWMASEESCRKVNSSFRDPLLRSFTDRAHRALFGAQRKIAAVLGNLCLPIVFSDCKWGPGATFDLRRELATPDKKMTEVISVTAKAMPYLRANLESDPHWAACLLGIIPEGPYSLLPSNFNIVPGSRFLTVPKNAKTDRCIAAEPTGNSFLQQGIHSYMRRRLRRFGVDLDEQSINQQRARDAYNCGLATLDLSAASDTISRELVFHLLPVDWALLLDDLRSHSTLVDGTWIRTEKFASMGNAFCFELETLIFWALASSVDEVEGSVDSVTVYGDDIIVPRHAYDSVVEILSVCGFTVNAAKSYKDGNFYESCGKHYFRGDDVTPVYQKEVLTHPSEVIRAHNRLTRLASRSPSKRMVHIVHQALHNLCAMYKLRPFPRIPFGCVEDGGFLRPLTDFSVDRNHGFRCQVYDFVPSILDCREDAMYAYKLRRFERLNPSEKGYAGNASEGKWRTRVRWIPERSVIDDMTTTSQTS